MRKFTVRIAVLAAIVFSLLGTLKAFAAPAIWIAPTGGRIWTVMGSGLEGIGGISLTIRYDTNLTNPTVTKGSVVAGTMGGENTSTPGVIRFAAVSATPFSITAGDIVKIEFQGGAGKILSISSELATASNNPQIVKVTPVIQDSSTPSTDTTSTTATTSSTTTTISSTTTTTSPSSSSTVTTGSSTAGQTALLGVTIPSDDAASRVTREQPRQPEPLVEPRRAEPFAPDTVTTNSEPERRPTAEKAEKKEQHVSFKSALERFRDFKGQRTPEELLALFVLPQKGYRQEPPLFLADGTGTLKVIIPTKASAKAAPNFAIGKEAQLASLPKVDDDSWVIVLRPKQGAYQVLLSYFLDDVSTDIPLTVAPALQSYNGRPFSKMDGNDLIKFLDRPEPFKVDLSKDLNGDKQVDYIDDYIFAANYLVKSPKVTTPAQSKQDKGLEQ